MIYLRARHYIGGVLAIMAGACVVLFAARYEVRRVSSGSMEPSICTGDIILVRKPLRDESLIVARGDIVLANFNGQSTVSVKRVIAFGGDNVTFDHGRVEVNGQTLYENYACYSGYAQTASASSPVEEIVPNQTLYLLGDNRNISSDSRYLGPVDFSHVLGRIVAEISVQPWRRCPCTSH